MDAIEPVDAQATESPIFTPQEEAFLRSYSESLSRIDAMKASGFSTLQTLQQADEQAILARSAQILARADKLSLSAICNAVGADKGAFAAVLWKWCQAERGSTALQALNLLARIHGLWDKEGKTTQQVALVFAGARQPPSREKPVDLPFTLNSSDYSVFAVPTPDPDAEADLENGPSK